MKIITAIYQTAAGLWRHIFGRRVIDNAESLHKFVAAESARAAGEMTMKYSQKRLGRGHFRMCRDEGYARALVNCQIALHAEIIADTAHLLTQQLNLPTIPPPLQKLMQTIHQNYANTAPAQTRPADTAATQLTCDHFHRGGGVKELSDKTGAMLFGYMPLTEDLLPANKQIFQGQLRAYYIALLQKFNNRANKQNLKTKFRQN